MALCSRLTSLSWQRVPDPTQPSAWQAGSPGGESPAQPPNPRQHGWVLGRGWLGAGRSSLSPSQCPPHSSSVPPTLPQAVSVPRLTTTQRSQGEAKTLLGYPNIF